MNTTNSIISACMAICFLSCFALTGEAGKVKPLSLDKITKSSEFIFEGKCTDIKTGQDEESGMLVTWYTFEVIRGIKGKFDKTYTFKQLGGTNQDQILTVPITQYTKNEHVILFLYPKSKIGFTSSVGMNQGKFYIKEMEETGITYVSNGMPGMTLFSQMDQNLPAVTTKGVTTNGMEVLRSERFEKEEFVNLVEQIINQQILEKQ